MPDNFFTFIGSAITKLFTHAAFFQAIGVSTFRLTVALLLFLFGAETVLTGYFDMRKFVRLVFMILVCLTLITYYSAPAPFVGRSLHSLITDEAKYLSDQLETGTNETLQTKLNAAYLQMETPTYFSGLALTITWFVAICLIALLRLVMLAVVAFSYMALGIIVMLGPLFIPSLIWPGLEFLFWGWIKSFMSYALYQVVASAMVFITANVMTSFFDANPGPYGLEKITTMFVELVAIIGTCIYSIVKVPSLASSILSGRGGESIVRESL